MIYEVDFSLAFAHFYTFFGLVSWLRGQLKIIRGCPQPPGGLPNPYDHHLLNERDERAALDFHKTFQNAVSAPEGGEGNFPICYL